MTLDELVTLATELRNTYAGDLTVDIGIKTSEGSHRILPVESIGLVERATMSGHQPESVRIYSPQITADIADSRPVPKRAWR